MVKELSPSLWTRLRELEEDLDSSSVKFSESTPESELENSMKNNATESLPSLTTQKDTEFPNGS